MDYCFLSFLFDFFFILEAIGLYGLIFLTIKLIYMQFNVKEEYKLKEGQIWFRKTYPELFKDEEDSEED